MQEWIKTWKSINVTSWHELRSSQSLFWSPKLKYYRIWLFGGRVFKEVIKAILHHWVGPIPTGVLIRGNLSHKRYWRCTSTEERSENKAPCKSKEERGLRRNYHLDLGFLASRTLRIFGHKKEWSSHTCYNMN